MDNGIRDISAFAAVSVLLSFIAVFVWLFHEALLLAIPDSLYRAVTRRFPQLESDRISRILIRRSRRSVRVVGGSILYNRFAHLRVRTGDYEEAHVHRLQYEALCLHAVNVEGAERAERLGLSWTPATRFELVLTTGPMLGVIMSDVLPSPWRGSISAAMLVNPDYVGSDFETHASPSLTTTIARTNPPLFVTEVLTVPIGTPGTNPVVGHRWRVNVSCNGRMDTHVVSNVTLLNVGRNPMSEIRLPIGQLDLSANHLQLVFDLVAAVIDVSSTGVRIRRAGQIIPIPRMGAPVPLLDGDSLELGTTTGDTPATVTVERLG